MISFNTAKTVIKSKSNVIFGISYGKSFMYLSKLSDKQ